jgi:hypothetical protein
MGMVKAVVCAMKSRKKKASCTKSFCDCHQHQMHKTGGSSRSVWFVGQVFIYDVCSSRSFGHGRLGETISILPMLPVPLLIEIFKIRLK